MEWLGSEVADPTGRPYARLDEVFVGRTSGRPEFGIVTLLDAPGRDERVAIPLSGARSEPDGSLVLGVDHQRVLGAPRVQRDVDEIPAHAGRLILQHFGASEAAAEGTVAMQRDDEPTEVVRHEEQLTVSTRAEVAERVRVRKHVVTEEVTLTVTLRREELVIERMPVDVGDLAAAPADFPEAADGGEVEFVLHAEEPVVTRRVVPVERVSLRRETSTELRHVTDTVRKERVDIDAPTPIREDH